MWKFLKEFAFPYKYYYLSGLVALVITTYVTTLIPLEIKNAINAVESQATTDDITAIIVKMIVLAIILIIARSLSRILIFIPGRNVEHDLRNTLFKHFLALPNHFYKSRKIGDLMSIMINDAQSLRATTALGFLHIMNTIMIFVFVFYQMSKLNLPLAVWVFIPVPLSMILVSQLVAKLFKEITRNQKNLGDLTNFCVETLTSIHLIKSFGQEKSIEKHLDIFNQEYEDSTLAVAKIRSQMFPFISIIGSIGHLSVFVIGGYFIIKGQLNLGEFAAYLGFVEMLAWPTASMAWIINIFQRSKAALVRINAIREYPITTELALPMPQAPSMDTPPKLTFKNLTFYYENQTEPALKDLSITIEAGKCVGIFGPTGSGKTTLVNLICGFETPSPTHLLLNDIDITTWPIESIHRGISMVSQAPYLFSETVENNIHYAPTGPKPSEKSNLFFATQASLLSDIRTFPKQFQTLTGEKGIILSGGQKTRLALARALHKPHTLLILDDVLSAVDHTTEQTLVNTLFNRDNTKNSATKIIISHRISALSKCDTILVLNHGQLLAQGTHAQLIATEGLYKTAWQYQQLLNL